MLSTNGAFPYCASISNGANTKFAKRRTCRKRFAPSSKRPAANTKPRRPLNGERPFGIAEGGKIIHEVGTARMGADAKSSVLNGFCQAHDVKNVFVMDGAPLVTNPDKNPTLTIMALAWRASEYLLDEAKKGNL